jgi:hypothetical protein
LPPPHVEAHPELLEKPTKKRERRDTPTGEQ